MSETRLDTFVIGEVRRELGQFFCKLTSHASFLRGFPRFSQQLSFQKYTTFAPFLYSIQDLLSRLVYIVQINLKSSFESFLLGEILQKLWKSYRHPIFSSVSHPNGWAKKEKKRLFFKWKDLSLSLLVLTSQRQESSFSLVFLTAAYCV